jgi:Pectinacetylesterase
MRVVISVALVFLGVSLRAAAPINEVLPCGKVGVAGGLGAGTDLQRITVDTKRFPEALCNDGSPAVFYIGRYTKDEDRNKWIIFLQGGGACGNAQACAERWCSIDTNYGMDKMTSTLTKASIRGNGFMDPSSANHFGSWNRVLVFYCSSDEWTGTKTSTVHASLNNVGADFAINFKGSLIVDAVIDTLRRTGRRRAVLPPGTPALNALPDLDDATHVLFAGSSGGGQGVKNNADRVGAALKGRKPSLVYRALIDAAFLPLLETQDYSRTVGCQTDPVHCSYATSQQESWTLTDQTLRGSRVDESCLTWHAAHQPGTEWRCGDSTHLSAHHITTPFFIHMDEQDSNIGGQYIDEGFGSAADFGRAVEKQLRDLATYNATAEEGSVKNGGAPLATPGAFGPQCTNHESFTNDGAVYGVKVDGLTYQDVVWNWWNGAQPQVAIRTFTPPGGAVAGCPPQ